MDGREDSRPDPSGGNDSRPAGTGPKGSNKYLTNRSASSRHRSFLTRMGESFKRSGGQRGADVQTIRGTRGAEFEGTARVLRGESGLLDCGCFGDRDEQEEKLLLVKGTFCFVFYDENDLAPKYAISLTKMKALVRDSGEDHTIVTLESAREIEYEISFDDVIMAKAFRDAVAKQSALGKAEFAAKRRGQAALPNKHSSTRYAEAVAKRKVNSQPENLTGLTSQDVLAAGL